MFALAVQRDAPKSSPDAEPRRRAYDRNEKLVDLAVHLIGGSAASAGALALLLAAGGRGWAVVAPVAIYALTLVATFAASAAYNLGYETRLRVTLRRLDHSAIFAMIAGTYTPFTVRLAQGSAAVWSTAAVWSIAAAGIGLKLFSPALFERIGVALYLALGWAALVIVPDIAPRLTPLSLALLAAGGALYTIGVCFHVKERLRFHNAIWHVFVVAAASCHFVSVLTGVALR
jgi:hemolysin III